LTASKAQLEKLVREKTTVFQLYILGSWPEIVKPTV